MAMAHHRHCHCHCHAEEEHDADGDNDKHGVLDLFIHQEIEHLQTFLLRSLAMALVMNNENYGDIYLL